MNRSLCRDIKPHKPHTWWAGCDVDLHCAGVKRSYRLTWWQQALFLLGALIVFSTLFILLSLAIHGHVRWA